MRNLSLLLSVPLLVACGKAVVDQTPSANETPAGREAPQPSETAGSHAERASAAGAGSHPTTPPALDAGTPRTGAGTQSKPAADSGSDDDAGSVLTTLCDGSSAVRLAYFSSGGLVAETTGFTNPRGLTFLAIDGQCRYFVEGNYMRGILSGTLAPAEAEQLSSELHWTDLDSWAFYGVYKDAACADSGVVGLMKAKASAGCSCGCDPAAPSGLGDALEQAYKWAQRLRSTGKPLDGAVSAVILEGANKSPSQPEFKWPLSRAIGSIPNLIVDRADSKLWMGAGPWARFEAAADYAQLREIRSATTKTDTSSIQSQSVFLRDGNKAYSLFVRDELPAETSRALEELQATLPKQP